MDKLVDMLKEMDSNHQRTLIFVETKKLADVVAGRLSDEERMSATSMHGDRSQEQREMALEDFRRGKDQSGVRYIPVFSLVQANIPFWSPPRSLPGVSTSTTSATSSTSRCPRRLRNTSTGELELANCPCRHFTFLPLPELVGLDVLATLAEPPASWT